MVTIEDFSAYVAALTAALGHCDGILASAEPLGTLAAAGALGAGQRTYLSLNRTGLAGSAFELDDRAVASVWRAAEDGWTGIKHMTRIDLADPVTAGALELLGQVLEEARTMGLEALVESVVWRDGAMARDPDAIVLAAVIAHDMGAPLLKVPVPDVRRPAPPGSTRWPGWWPRVGVPVLFLGGPRGVGGHERVLDEVRDVMAGGGAGMAIGRTIYEDPSPGEMAGLVAVDRAPRRSDDRPVSR